MAYDGSIRIDTKVDTSQAKKNVNSLGDGMKKLGKIVASVFAVAAIVNFTKQSISAFSSQAEAEAQLTSVLKNRFNATQDVIQSVKDLTTAQQMQGVIGDEVQQAGLAALSTYMSNIENVTGLTEAMNDLTAAQYGYGATTESTAQIARQMGKAVATGQLSVLKRMGVTCDEATEEAFKMANEEERVAILSDLVKDKVGGMNKALASTPYGQFIQLQNSWGDIKEVIGEAATNFGSIFLPALNKSVNVLGQMANKLLELSKAFQQVFGVNTANKELSKSAQSAAISQEEVAQSIEDTGEAIAGNLASFDELNIMNDTATEGEDTSTENGSILSAEAETETTQEVSGDMIAFAEKVKSVLVPALSTLKNILSELGSIVATIWNTAVVPIAKAFSTLVLPKLKELITACKGLIEALKPVFAFIGDKLLKATAEGGSALSGILGGGISRLTTIVNLATSAFKGFAETLNGTTSIGDFVSGLVEVVGNIIENILNMLGEAIPKLLEILQNILISVIDAIVENLPTILSTVVKVINSITKTLIQNISVILKAIVKVIMAICDCILENLPTILDMGIELLMSLIQGIIENLPLLVEAVLEIITTLVDYILENLPYIVECAVELIKALIQGIIKALPLLLDAVIKIILKLVDFLTDPHNLQSLIESAFELVGAIVKGIYQAVGKLVEAAGTLVFKIIDTIIHTDWLDVGKQIILGIWNGFKSMIGSVWQGIKDWCSSIWTGIKNFFGIASPSKLMRDTVGNYIAIGVGVGFEDEIGNIGDQMEKDLQNTFDTSWGNVKTSFSDLPAPRVNVNDLSPISTSYSLLNQDDGTTAKIRDVVEDIADDLSNLKGDGEETIIQVVDSSGNIKSQQTVKEAKRENRKAGKTIIPVGA